MKLIRFQDQHGRAPAWLAISAGLLVAFTQAQAAPGGSASGFGAVGAGTSSSSGGGHGGAVTSSGAYSSGGSHVGASNFGHSPSAFRGTATGFTNGLSTNGARLGGNFSSSSNRNVAIQGGYRNNVQGQNQNAVSPMQIARVNNLWSEQAPANAQQNSSAQTSIPLNLYGRGSTANQRGSYTRLYPGSYGYNSPAYNDTRHLPKSYGNGQRDVNRLRQFRGRNSYYIFNNGYYPYLGGYGYYSGDVDLDSNYANIAQPYVEGGPSPDDGANQPPLQNGVVNPGAVTPPGATQLVPSPGPQLPAGSQQPPGSSSSRGPDSLVEAVQSELSNRGYFKGKVDAMFNDDTKDAIRRFQKDNQLSVTGLLNNATLVMLGLN